MLYILKTWFYEKASLLVTGMLTKISVKKKISFCFYSEIFSLPVKITWKKYRGIVIRIHNIKMLKMFADKIFKIQALLSVTETTALVK